MSADNGHSSTTSANGNGAHSNGNAVPKPRAEWIANRRRALGIIAKIEDVSERAGELLLKEVSRPADRQVP